MYRRNAAAKLLIALKETPVVFLNGARQVGKSTLAKEISKKSWPAEYVTLDNINTLIAVQADPLSFIRQHTSTSLIIDEIQRAPELFLSIKESVDKDRRPGRFLLTGSANVLLLPHMSESLVGRMEIISLWPFSQGELRGVRDSFVDKVFSKDFHISKVPPFDKHDFYVDMLRGGYPEVLTRKEEVRQFDWFNAYVETMLHRDVRELAHIEGLTLFPKLLSLLASRASSLLNYSELSRTSGISHTTLIRYITLLQTLFLVQIVPPWSNNLSKRLVKTPKVYLCDTGLLAYFLGVNADRLEADPALAGNIVENFVVMELKKQLGWCDTRAELFHYRTQSGQEVDVVLEDFRGHCVGIEVKASTTLTGKDFNGLRSMEEHLKKKFLRGIVLYLGEEVLSFGENLLAVPISALWK